MQTREIILTLMEAADQLRVFHWQTKCYAEHVALGSLYDAVSDAADEFAETLIGIESGKRPSLKDSIVLSDYSKDMPAQYITLFAKELSSISGSSDIENMRDDLLAKCHKTLYLLSLNEEEEEIGEKEEAGEGEPAPAVESVEPTTTE